ncbi:Uncharacterised protein [Porphyromonas macacae]|uniref:Uncharacterized protein n=1 Tax=Porphyromonas macacae TaxID=28115 RepID=A0A379EG55_9PORP|nr:Uncharacterised protein [Porphyromonas macacae]
MIFSNNMEYDSLGGIVPIQGAFYCLVHVFMLLLIVFVKKIYLLKK